MPSTGPNCLVDGKITFMNKECLDCKKEIKQKARCGTCASRRWRANNPHKVKEYLLKDKDKQKQRVNAWQTKNKEQVKEISSTYYRNNKDKIYKKHREWTVNNRSTVRSLQSSWRVNRYSTDIRFRLACILRARINKKIKSVNKDLSTIKDLGCTVIELKTHLESKWLPGMSWDNYGRLGWHIDHIKPLSSFDLTDTEQFKNACHYTNLQPLWAIDNLKKGSKITGVDKDK